MKKYELNGGQEAFLTASFATVPTQDGQAAKGEHIQNVITQTARKLMQLSPECPEQIEGIKKLRECAYWFKEACLKHEGF